jgi:hypothetical protein
MTEKKSWAERYPNWRNEYRKEVVTQMMPANGWWKVFVNMENESWIAAVAFFAKVEYETRSTWDNGHTDWKKEEVIYANTGHGDEWSIEFQDELGGSSTNARLFYDPDFRLSQEQQTAGESWLLEFKKPSITE